MSIQPHPTPSSTSTETQTPRSRTLVPYSPDPVTWGSVIVVAAALAIYVRTLMPGVGFWDTAEAQTVPYTLSIFHPTGFPTYTLLGWLWSQIPIGEVAYRMNLFSAVCIALAAGLVVHIAGHLIAERHRLLQGASASVAGGAFAFASEPWRNAVRADVHALHVFFAALVIWLLFCWAAAERRRDPNAGRWLLAAAFGFGLGLGNHALMGLLAFGIAAWLIAVDPFIWRRWRLILLGAVFLLAGLSVYLYIPLRAVIDPEPPLLYARPDNLERLRYLIFAEQFTGLFSNFGDPLGDLGPKWAKAESVLGAQFATPAWLLIGVGFVVVVWRRLGAAAFLGLIAVANVIYSMNFQDGDIDRYYMTTVLAATPLLGVTVAAVGSAYARAAWLLARRVARRARRRVAFGAGTVVVLLAMALPVYGVVDLYGERDLSGYQEASRWVDGVYSALPRNAVVVSWWSYSTPLWYHRWVLGERPDVKIIDDRNILDDGYGDVPGAIDAFLGERPVYVVPNDYTGQLVHARYETESVHTAPGYTDLLHVLHRK
ncbi:MAG: DUF2723 domain-containing protein [Chloroflexota bacterium]|nr:DUF2723 domain-containing protein [Chloroflexota bacterium]